MESFRNMVQSWWGRTFLFIVLVVFVVFAFGPQFLTPAGSQGEVAEVEGDKIFARELDQAVEQMMARYGNQIDRKTLEQLVKRDDVLESLIRQRVLVHSARDAGVVVAPDVLQQSILSIDAFKDPAGKFSQEIFMQLITRNGYANAAAFRTRLEEDLLVQQVTGALRDSSFATRQDLELLTRMGEQKRDLAWVMLSPAAFVGAVSVADAEVQARYDANPAGYLTEEQFAVEYIEVNLDQFSADQKIADADVRAKYDEMVAKARENAERRVAHILVRVDGNRDEQQAKARADEILAKLAAGESFVKLAAEYSDDAGTKAQGGDLGFVGRGVLDASLDSALFALKQNDVSLPVKGSDGIHLLKMLEVRAVDVPPFEQARAGIVAGLGRDKAREKFDSVVDELGTLAYESDNLQDPAGKLGLTINSSGLFGRAGGPGILANPKVLAEVTSADVLEDGRNSGVVKLGDSQALVLRIKEHRKPERRPFAEVAGVVRTELLREKAAAVVGEKAASLQAAIKAGTPVAAAAAAAGLQVEQAAGVQRASQAVPREVLQAGFRARRPQAAASSTEIVDLAGGGKALVVVSNVVDGTLLGVAPQEIANRRGQLAGEYGSIDFRRYVEQETAVADVTRIRVATDDEGPGVADVIKDLKNKSAQRP